MNNRWWRYEFSDNSCLLWSNTTQAFLHFDALSNWVSISVEDGIDDETTVECIVQEDLLSFAAATKRVDDIRALLHDPLDAHDNLDSRKEEKQSIPFMGYTPVSSVDCSTDCSRSKLQIGGAEVTIAFFDDLASNTIITAPFAHLLTPELTILAHNIGIGRLDERRLWVNSDVTGGYIAESIEDSMALLYWMIFRTLQTSRDWMFCLHAGAVVADKQIIIVTGPSGAGKTTLTLALSKKHQSYLTDELVCVERITHNIYPMPTLPCVKEGAWTEIENYYLDILTTPSIFRLGKFVKFLPLPENIFSENIEPRKEDAIVLVPSFDPNTKENIVALNPVTVLQAILNSGGLVGDMQTQESFIDLGNWLSKVSGYQITYGNTRSAIELCARAVKQSEPGTIRLFEEHNSSIGTNV